MPTPPPIFGGHHILHVGRTVDVSTRARFQVNRFRGFGASGGRKWPSRIDLAHHPYNSVTCHTVILLFLQTVSVISAMNHLGQWYWLRLQTSYAATVCPRALWPWPLTFWPWKWCPSHVWRGYLCANFSLPRPFCSRHRPDVHDRR